MDAHGLNCVDIRMVVVIELIANNDDIHTTHESMRVSNTCTYQCFLVRCFILVLVFV